MTYVSSGKRQLKNPICADVDSIEGAVIHPSVIKLETPEESDMWTMMPHYYVDAYGVMLR
jgi:hypothetical protein